MSTEPVAVALKFGFLAVLFLFLLWVSRSALRELRAAGSVTETSSGGGIGGPGGRAAVTDAFLVAVTGGGLHPGSRFDLFGGVTIGRSEQADIQIEDRYASGIHARVYSRGPVYYAEDMGSTNGTFLNDAKLDGEASLGDLATIRIGDTELRFELDVPGGA